MNGSRASFVQQPLADDQDLLGSGLGLRQVVDEDLRLRPVVGQECAAPPRAGRRPSRGPHSRASSRSRTSDRSAPSRSTICGRARTSAVESASTRALASICRRARLIWTSYARYPPVTAATRIAAAAELTSVRLRLTQRRSFSQHRLRPRRHRLVGQPELQVVGQVAGRVVSVLRAIRHRLQADRFEGRRDPAG